MPSKKRAYLQQFGIIHLPNLDLTYIRNPERETKLYLCPSTSWKLKSWTLLCYLFLFSPSHLTRNHDANRAPRAYIYALEAVFSQVAKNCQVFCQTIGGVFLTFLPKIKDGNSICQTAGDALRRGIGICMPLCQKVCETVNCREGLGTMVYLPYEMCALLHRFL